MRRSDLKLSMQYFETKSRSPRAVAKMTRLLRDYLTTKQSQERAVVLDIENSMLEEIAKRKTHNEGKEIAWGIHDLVLPDEGRQAARFPHEVDLPRLGAPKRLLDARPVRLSETKGSGGELGMFQSL